MLFAETPFTSTILPIPVTRLGAHPNVVMAVLAGRAGPITVEHAGVSVTGDVLRVRPGIDLLQYALDFRNAKALLLDAFQEGLHGGTGAVFDWNLIPQALPLPIVLSGGLTPENVTEAVRRVKPWAVDVSSGVELRKGIKDARKIAAFITGVRNADV